MVQLQVLMVSADPALHEAVVQESLGVSLSILVDRNLRESGSCNLLIFDAAADGGIPRCPCH